DFIPTNNFLDKFRKALDIMETDAAIDLVRFYSYCPYPYVKPPDKFGFSVMYLPALGYKHKKIYQYSDHPHLRRSDFLSKFGRYKEGIAGDRTEYAMCISFLQNK